MGQLVQPTKATATTTAVELPPYDPDSKTIVHNGETIEAPDGVKFITEDGQTFILRHARMLKGGWHKLRVNTKASADGATVTLDEATEPTSTQAAATEAPARKRH